MEKINLRSESILDKIAKYINIVPPFLIVFIPLLLLYLSQNLNGDGNEEQYMQLAKQYVNPDWIFESQNLTESAGTRILYQLVIGHTLQLLSFETTVLIFRFLLICGFSIVISKIYKTLSIDNTQGLLHLLLFIIVFNQSFFAGSWMLLSVEPKGFAYLFILFSFYFLLKNRPFIALIFLIVSSYLHILVGGYSFAYLFLTLLLFRKDYPLSLRQLILGTIVYTISLIPLVIYLKATSLNYDITSNQVSPSWIYTYFRTPHHTALFYSFNYFVSTHLEGIIQSTLGLLLAIIMYPKLQNRNNLRLINLFVIISMTATLLLVPVAFFDKTGDILKFYLYRINTLSAFFLALLIPVWIYLLTKKQYIKLIQVLIFAGCTLYLIKPVRRNLKRNFGYTKLEKSIDEVSAFLKKNTDPKSLVFSYGEYTSLIRKAERNLFVVTKYIPAQLDKVQEWYQRVLEKRQVIQDPLKMKELVDSYNINFILVPNNEKVNLDYEVVFENNDFLLYESGESGFMIDERYNYFSQLKSIEYFNDYIDFLKDKDVYVFIAVKDEASNQLTNQLYPLGSKINWKGKARWSYVGIFNPKKNFIKEFADSTIINYSEKKSEAMPFDVRIESSGYTSGNSADIYINEERATGITRRGLNLVIYDYTLDRIIDLAHFDTHGNSNPQRGKIYN